MSLTWGKCLAENEMLRAQIAVIPEEIARQTKALRDDLDYLLEEITDYHREYGEKDCDTCDGEGEIEISVTCDYPSRMDSFVPAERIELDTCEDCRGTGKEWGMPAQPLGNIGEESERGIRKLALNNASEAYRVARRVARESAYAAYLEAARELTEQTHKWWDSPGYKKAYADFNKENESADAAYKAATKEESDA
tara:strand:+ start:2330 stop:2914 length:585 start_codon:yes stop_codon:yes gene_type:complete